MKFKIYVSSFIILGLTILFVIAEISLSNFILNPRFYKSKVPNIEITSNSVLVPDTLLGWDLRPGYKNQNTDIMILSTNSRFCGKPSYDTTLKTIAFYGCSYGFGQGLSSTEVFSYHLQQKYPQLSILNQSVPAYGNVQMFQKLKKDVSNGIIPEKVILLWADFHPLRNIPTPSWKLLFGIGLGRKLPENYPYPACNISQDEFQYTMNPIKSYQVKGYLQNNSAIFCTLKYFVNYAIEIMNYEDILKPTIIVLNDMNKYCLERGIMFEIATLIESKESNLFIEVARKNGLTVHDISLPFDDISEYKLENDPFHPNAKAHIAYSNRIGDWLLK